MTSQNDDFFAEISTDPPKEFNNSSFANPRNEILLNQIPIREVNATKEDPIGFVHYDDENTPSRTQIIINKQTQEKLDENIVFKVQEEEKKRKELIKAKQEEEEKIKQDRQEKAKEWLQEMKQNYLKIMESTKTNNMTNEKVIKEKKEQNENNWDKALSLVELKEGNYPGTKNVSRMKQSMIGRKNDIKNGLAKINFK